MVARVIARQTTVTVPARDHAEGSQPGMFTATLLQPSGRVETRLTIETPAPATLDYGGHAWRRAHQTASGFAYWRMRR